MEALQDGTKKKIDSDSDRGNEKKSETGDCKIIMAEKDTDISNI